MQPLFLTHLRARAVEVVSLDAARGAHEVHEARLRRRGGAAARQLGHLDLPAARVRRAGTQLEREREERDCSVKLKF